HFRERFIPVFFYFFRSFHHTLTGIFYRGSNDTFVFHTFLVNHVDFGILEFLHFWWFFFFFHLFILHDLGGGEFCHFHFGWIWRFGRRRWRGFFLLFLLFYFFQLNVLDVGFLAVIIIAQNSRQEESTEQQQTNGSHGNQRRNKTLVIRLT